MPVKKDSGKKNTDHYAHVSFSGKIKSLFVIARWNCGQSRFLWSARQSCPREGSDRREGGCPQLHGYSLAFRPMREGLHLRSNRFTVASGPALTGEVLLVGGIVSRSHTSSRSGLCRMEKRTIHLTAGLMRTRHQRLRPVRDLGSGPTDMIAEI